MAGNSGGDPRVYQIVTGFSPASEGRVTEFEAGLFFLWFLSVIAWARVNAERSKPNSPAEHFYLCVYSFFVIAQIPVLVLLYCVVRGAA